MPYPVTTAYEVDAAIAAGVAESFGEKVAVCAWGGAIYSTGYDLTISSASSPFYVFKSIDGGLTWTAIATGIDGGGSIISDYYWDGTSNTFYIAVLKLVGATRSIQCCAFDMALDTVTVHSDPISPVGIGSQPRIAAYGTALYVMHSAVSTLIPTVSYSGLTSGAWTSAALDTSGGVDYLPGGMCVDSATGNVHCFHTHLGTVSAVAHSIINGTTVTGPDWFSAGPGGTADFYPQRAQMTGDGRIALLGALNNAGFVNWFIYYATDPTLNSPLTAEGDFNDRWTSALFAQDHDTGSVAFGDLVSRPTGWTVLWLSRGTSGTDLILKYVEMDDPLSPGTEQEVFDAGGLGSLFNCSARLLDDGEYHAIVSLPYSAGSHEYGSDDNWLLNPYAGAAPATTVLNYAF